MLSTLKKRAHFLRVKKLGKSWASRSFILQAACHSSYSEDMMGASHVGYIVTKKIGKAVTRNYVKRRFKEACRYAENTFRKNGVDYILIARDSAKTIPYAQLTKDLEWALKHVHRLLDQ